MKKLKTGLRLVLTLGILSCLVFGAAGCENKLPEAGSESNLPEGTVYSLETAYENNLLSKADLREIANYYNSQSGCEEKLDAKIAQAIKATLTEDYKKENSGSDEKSTAKAFEIKQYYGRYGSCYAVLVGNNDEPSYSGIEYSFWKEVGEVGFRPMYYAKIYCFVDAAEGETNRQETSFEAYAADIGAYAELLLERNEYTDENRAAIETIKAEGMEAVKLYTNERELEKTANDIKYRMDAVAPIENYGDSLTGTGSSLEKAYENGYITKGDLERIAYYFNTYKIEYPRPINERVEHAIKEARAESYRNQMINDNHSDWAEKVTPDGFKIVGYYGKYNDCYLVTIDSDYWEYPAMPINYWEDICGVQFHFTDYGGISLYMVN